MSRGQRAGSAAAAVQPAPAGGRRPRADRLYPGPSGRPRSAGPADEEEEEMEQMEMEEEYSAQWGSFPPLEKGQTSAEWLPERRLGQDGPEEPSPASGDVVPKVAYD